MEFCKAYNAATEQQRGDVVPVEISIYEDRSFDFKLKTPPAARLLLKAAGVDKGSGTPNKTKVATVTAAQVREIATLKQVDLNANDVVVAASHLRHRPLDGHHRHRRTSVPRYLTSTTWQGRRGPQTTPPDSTHRSKNEAQQGLS